MNRLLMLKQRRCGTVSWCVIASWILLAALMLGGGMACSRGDDDAIAVEIRDGGIRAGDLLTALESRAGSGRDTSAEDRREILNS